MKRFEVLIVVKDRQSVADNLKGRNNLNFCVAADEEQAIEQMQSKDIDIIIYEGNADFGLRNKLRSMKNILRPNAEIIEYDERNIKALPDDLEIAMQKVNANNTSGNKFFDDL